MKYAKIHFVFLGFFLISFSLFAQEPDPASEGSVRLPEASSPPSEPAPAGQTTTPSPPTETKPVTPATAGEEEMVYLNVNDQEIKDVIAQISKATGRNFIIDNKLRGKVTILSEKKMTKEEAYQAFLSALEVAGYTTVVGPAGIIKLVALKDAISYPIPIHVDSTPFTDSYITRLITLQNISALEMSNTIKPLISKFGNMFAYPATNTLIITDSGTNIDRVMKVIKELDQKGPQQIVQIITIKYADAKEIAQTVLQLFSAQGARSQPAAVARRPATAGQPEDVEDVSQIIPDVRTNSLIVVASQRAINKVHEIIAQLDRPLGDGEGGKIHVHYLKYANAEEIAATLSGVTSKAGAAGATKEKGKENAIAELEGGITLASDKTTNALIITASAKDYRILVDELISKLDIPRRQVYLESMIMELSIDKGGNYGVKGFGGGALSSLLGFGQTFAATGGLGSLFSSDGLVGGVISRDNVTVDVPIFSGTQVTTQSVQLPAYSAFLNLLQTYSDANVISSPNILTLDNEEAEINITSKIYARKTTTLATGLQTSEPTPLESGLILKLTPQINEGDSVRLKIEQELSNFTGGADAITGAAPSRKRKINTTVITKDGQTVVLGGLMEDNITKSKSKFPVLGDIPLLGLLFQTSSSRTIKSNLLVFITPHVIRDPTDFSRVMKRKVEQRNEFIRENYGKRQRHVIEETLAAHRSDLLEFVPPVPTSELTPLTMTPPAPSVPALSEERKNPSIPKASVPSVQPSHKLPEAVLQQEKKEERVLPPSAPKELPKEGMLEDLNLAY